MKKMIRIANWVMGLMFIFAASAIDTESYIPYIMVFVSGAYLLLLTIANNFFVDMDEVIE